MPAPDYEGIKSIDVNQSGKLISPTASEFLNANPELGALSGAIATGNLLYVDAVNGDNATAARGSLKPYLTYAAARVAAVSGDVIVVRPGTYPGQVVLKNGVHIRCEPGVTFTHGGAVVTDNGVGCVMSITGAPLFSMNATESAHCFHLTHASSVVTVDWISIEVAGGNCAGIRIEAGLVLGTVAKIETDLYDCIWITGANAGLRLYVDHFLAGQEVVEIEGCSQFLLTFRLAEINGEEGGSIYIGTSVGAPASLVRIQGQRLQGAIFIQDAVGLPVDAIIEITDIDATECGATNYVAVYKFCEGSEIRNSRIKGQTAVQVDGGTGTYGGTFRGCTFISSGTYSINSTPTPGSEFRFYGGNVANKPTNNIVPLVGTVTVDTEVI